MSFLLLLVAIIGVAQAVPAGAFDIPVSDPIAAQEFAKPSKALE
jgi:hypothetical protein